MTTETQTDTQTYIVRVDRNGRPLVREFIDATSTEEALALEQARLEAQEDHEEGEVAAEAEPFQPILERIIERVAEGANYSLSFKHEDGNFGPVWITDMDAMRVEAEKQDAIRADGTIVLGVPFGTVPAYETPLPWMKKSEARRLAKYLGVPYGES